MLSNITEKIKQTPTFYVMLLVAVIVLCAATFFVLRNTQAQMKTQIDSGETKATSSQEAEIIFFYANWCPHCKAAKPHWEEIKDEYEGKEVNGYNLVFTDVDCTEETPQVKDKTSEYDIEGYPTIKLVKDGQVVDYDAKPTKETLEKFINTVL
jgi:thiol-disulfide isomerase/thioredoxin